MNNDEFDDTTINNNEQGNPDRSSEQNYIDDLNRRTKEDSIVTNSNNKTWQNQVKIWSIVLLLVGIILIPFSFLNRS